MRFLQVTYRKGQPFAAYLELSNGTGEHAVKTVASHQGLLLVDYASDGQVLGVEITAPIAVSRERLNELLLQLGQPPLSEEEFRPLQAA